METTLIVIPGELCDLNTYIKAERGHRILAAKIKSEETQRVWAHAYGKKVPKDMQYPIIVEAVWFVKDEKKDQDNITFAKKFILDGMKQAGMIPDDSRKFVRVWRDIDVLVDKQYPRVEVSFYSANL